MNERDTLARDLLLSWMGSERGGDNTYETLTEVNQNLIAWVFDLADAFVRERDARPYPTRQD